MSEDGNENHYVATEDRDETIRIEGPLNQQAAVSRKTIIEGQEGMFTAHTRADSYGEAILKILTTFINRKNHGL